MSKSPNIEAMRMALVRLRDERGLTYDELAERSELSRRTVAAIIAGDSTPTLATWWRLARALDVPLSRLIDELDS